MLIYALRRLCYSLVLLLLASTLIFFIVQVTPGSPYARMWQEMAATNPRLLAQIPDTHVERLNALYKLDSPFHERYIAWIKNLAVGDLGESWSVGKGASVSQVILGRLPYTLLLMLTAAGLSFLVAVPLALYSALNQYSNADFIITFASYFGMAMPSFWFGLLLISVFSSALGWLPYGGVASRNLAGQGDILTVLARVLTLGLTNRQIAGLEWAIFVDGVQHLIMPGITVSLLLTARWIRYLRTSILEVLGQDYIRAAHARGIPGWIILFKHCLRNSLIPLITTMALDIPLLFTGCFLVENIFSWPGIGRLYMDSLRGGDWPLLIGLLMVNAALLILANLIADLAYHVADPRISYAER